MEVHRRKDLGNRRVRGRLISCAGVQDHGYVSISLEQHSVVRQLLGFPKSFGAAAVVAQLLISDMPISIPDVMEMRVNEINPF